MAPDVVWWWSTHAPDDGLPLALGGDLASRPLDPLTAAVDELVCHLQARLDEALAAAYGSAGDVLVMRGWPADAGATKPRAPVLVAVTAGPMQTTRVPLTEVASHRDGPLRVRVLAHAYWTATITITLMCDDRATRDKVSPALHDAVDVIDTWCPRGLRLESRGYHGRPVAYRLTGCALTDDADTAMLGEWRGTWSLEAQSDLIVIEPVPAITQSTADVTAV